MDALERLNELHARFDGPVPPHLIAPPALTRLEIGADLEKIVACRRQLALRALAERRCVLRARLPYTGILEYADRCARIETRLWAEARATLARYRAELAALQAEAAEAEGRCT